MRRFAIMVSSTATNIKLSRCPIVERIEAS
jgi:hypothetical protein